MSCGSVDIFSELYKSYIKTFNMQPRFEGIMTYFPPP